MANVIPFINQKIPLSKIPSNSLQLNISNNNWKDKFPYSPKVSVRLWHDGANLFLNYEVEEEYVAALAKKDNDDVYKDSCVEFFIAFDNEGYYNLEANCIGKLLLSHRKGRKIDVKYADDNILSCIQRDSSLGKEPFECRKSNGKWSLKLTIPKSTFFLHDIKNFSELKVKCNIYKCGDNLPQPHFLSWQPIKTENPDFHRPEFFGPIEFE